jgi:cytochrome c oxidase assembly protein subunit 15
MVTSGLSDRVDVAPERLTVHLGLALLLLMGLLWTGLQAWSGPQLARTAAAGAQPPWRCSP